MFLTARLFPSFAEGLKISYEEEVSGEAFFTAMARHQPPASHQALFLFAAMERITCAALAPLIRRYGIETEDETVLQCEGAAEAETYAGRSWDACVAMMIETFPIFIEEFRALGDLAPGDDAAAIGILIQHEQAMLDFALLYRAGDANPLKPLEDFISLRG